MVQTTLAPTTGYSNEGSVINSANATNVLNIPNTNGDRCYRVRVTATNGVGTSASSVTSNAVHVQS